MKDPEVGLEECPPDHLTTHRQEQKSEKKVKHWDHYRSPNIFLGVFLVLFGICIGFLASMLYHANVIYPKNAKIFSEVCFEKVQKPLQQAITSNKSYTLAKSDKSLKTIIDPTSGQYFYVDHSLSGIDFQKEFYEIKELLLQKTPQGPSRSRIIPYSAIQRLEKLVYKLESHKVKLIE